MTHKIRFALLAALLVPLSVGTDVDAQGAYVGKPNVLLILTDDQGWGDLRSNGNTELDTPTMDQLASEGARFQHFYVSPMCGPTRASLLTGRYDLRTGASWVSHGLETMRLNETTLADAFQRDGYATGAFGKWHNGANGPYHPNQRGFDEFFGFCRGAWQNYFDARIEKNGEPALAKGYITDALTDQAIAFMEEHRNGPFFCYVPFNAPHHPFQVPPHYHTKYTARGCSDELAAVYGMVENIDDNLRRMLNKLDEWNISGRTIVIFLSDNGPSMPRPGEGEGPRYNGGLRGRKAEIDEGSVRVPCFIRWPEHIQAGLKIREIAAHIDVYPTLLQLCRLSNPGTLPLDGKSLVPLLSSPTDGPPSAWPDRRIFTHQNVFGDNRLFPGSVRTQDFRLTNRGQGYELYDMSADPGQEKNVAKKHPGLFQDLCREYEAWYRDVTSTGVDAPALPIGFSTTEVVALQAEDSKLSNGLEFTKKIGWAHDTVTNWMSTEESVAWDLDVLHSGSYEITLMYACAPSDTGARIELEIGDQQVSSRLEKAHDPQPPTPREANHKRVETQGPVWVRRHAPLSFPTVTLRKGTTRLIVRATEIPGKQALTLKEARVRLLP